MLIKFIILSIFLLSSCSSYKITVNGIVDHPNWGDDPVTEGMDNNLKGIEFKLSETGSLELTDFRNSFGHKQTRSINYTHRWFTGYKNGQYLGLKMGTVQGYSGLRWDIFILPVVIKEFEHHTFEFHWLPGVSIIFIKLHF